MLFICTLRQCSAECRVNIWQGEYDEECPCFNIALMSLDDHNTTII